MRIDAPSVSRHHARILVTEGRAMIEDLGSKNGTHLLECRLEAPALLRDGDAIRLGRQLLVYRRSPPDGTTLTEPDR